MAETAYQRPPSTASSTAKPVVTSGTTTAIPSFFSPRIVTPSRQNSSSSPNYFGFRTDDGGGYLSESPQLHAKKNWSPPSSTVRSTAVLSPSVIPVDQNPEFNAFKRHAEEKAFSLGGMGGDFRTTHQTPRRTTTRTSSDNSVISITLPESMVSRSRQTSWSHGSNGERSSPKRVLSPGAREHERRQSPAAFIIDEGERAHDQPRFRLPLDAIGGAYSASSMRRAEHTIPNVATPAGAESTLVTPQQVVTLLETHPEDILMLDLRVSTQYGDSHIDGALNLCIPTTLLKRPSFNVQKLTEIFKDEDQKAKFEQWRNTKYIIVYDGSSAQLKDAQTCLNTIKKFCGEGYQGTCCIIKGGFKEFARRFPTFVSEGVTYSGSASDEGQEDGPGAVPVIGGCPMPSTDQPANPFFGNIRQNMDLIGGVGQIALHHPTAASSTEEQDFPSWLRKAADEKDQGKYVSERFERIERREKKRMEDALSGTVTWERSGPASSGSPESHSRVQIAGIEKGSKNRYNNIWPYEHSRVRLQGTTKNECDYFNASFVQAGWSNKRYISTQAPIPATFTDFWNVVWQEDVRVIVMLTAEKEGAQVKAHNYWNAKRYGSLRLKFLSEKRASLELDRIHRHRKTRPGASHRSSTLSSNDTLLLAPLSSAANEAAAQADHDGSTTVSSGDQPYVIVRRFTLTNERKPFEPMREITQLQYSSWPDFGAPAHPAHLLGLVEQTGAVTRAVNNSLDQSSDGRPHGQRQHSWEPERVGTRPVLVHCSAGCGRTGTFCTVDSVIDMLKRQQISQPAASDEPRMDVDEIIDEKRRRSPGRQSQSKADASPVDSLQSDRDGPQGAWINHGDLDLVERTVEDFRHQRISMVQSLRQYVLCYESIMEWLVDLRREHLAGPST